MCVLEIQLYCPHCYSYNVVKNGKKVTGQQNFKCKECGKQFLHEYLYWGAVPANKRLMSRMLVRGSGVSDIAQVLPYEKHLIGKKFTKAIEGVNTALRLRNRRINRKTTCFSKKEANHIYAMNITISYFNHHTF